MRITKGKIFDTGKDSKWEKRSYGWKIGEGIAGNNEKKEGKEGGGWNEWIQKRRESEWYKRS